MFLNNKQKLAFVLSIVFILTMYKIEIANLSPLKEDGKPKNSLEDTLKLKKNN